MNELTKHPMLLMIAGVLVAVALVIGAKGSGSTYAVSGGLSAADIKARADAQSISDKGLTDARTGVMATILGYQKQRDDFQTSTLKISTDASTTRYQTDAGVRLGIAGLESGERMATDSNRTELAIAQGQQQVESQNGVLNFFGNLISGIVGLFI